MKVNFDGMRKNATQSMNELYNTMKSIIENDDIYDYEKEDIINTFNEAAMSVDVFNCLYDDREENFNDLSDLSIERLEEIE